ncbi:MAG: toxin-antitoxin system YwqK family antitoxin [Alphaproteobacteria bacterium]|nr:toxin-antitoxin system YwqK family antitoxin [Alphaproteobacteria bacterium]
MKKTAVVVALVMMLVGGEARCDWRDDISSSFVPLPPVHVRIDKYPFYLGVDEAFLDLDDMTSEDGEHLLCAEEQRVLFCTDKNRVPVTGIAKLYYDDGQLRSKINFKDGKLDGVWEGYFRDGKLQITANFKDGEADGVWRGYSSNGQLEKEGSYKNDRLDGVEKKYYENGQLKWDGNYKNDKRDGAWKWYYENGQLKEEGNYINGGRDGVWKQYYENGEVKFYEKVQGEEAKTGDEEILNEEGAEEEIVLDFLEVKAKTEEEETLNEEGAEEEIILDF